jgi:hypothetical protein
MQLILAIPFCTDKNQTISQISEKDSIIVYNSISFLKIKLNSSAKNPKIGHLSFFQDNENLQAFDFINKDLYTIDQENFTANHIANFSQHLPKSHLRLYTTATHIWLADVSKGVYMIEKKRPDIPPLLIFKDYLISNIIEDKEGNILFSTFNKGVIVVPDIYMPDVVDITKNEKIISIKKNNNSLLLGTQDGKLLELKDGHVQQLNNSGNRPLLSIFVSEKSPLIIYDDGQIRVIDTKTDKHFTLPIGSLKDAVFYDDSVFFLAINSGIMKVNWDKKESFKHEFINLTEIRTYATTLDKNDNSIYVSTSDGLYRFSSSKKIHKVLYNGSPIYPTALLFDSSFILLSTKGGNLLKVQNGKVIDEKEIKLNNNPVEITKFISYQSSIIANTSEGLIELNKNGDVIRKINFNVGVASKNILDFEIERNNLWVAQSKGLQNISLNHQNTTKKTISFYIDYIKVNDSIYPSKQNIPLESNQRKIEFQVIAPTLKNRDNIIYIYRLKGYDNNWIKSNFDDNKFTYNALSPGSYTFEVKIATDGAESESKSFSFSIATPFYTRWWFWLFSSLMSIVIVSLIYRWQLQVQKRKSRLANELNSSKLTAIRSQMNPHFVFNALNSIQDLVLKGDIENSYTYITTFSNLVRKTLNYSDKDFIGIEQEIDLLKVYLSLEKLRFKNTLTYEINIENVEEVMLPPMLIQPFIENALLHGLLHKKGERRIVINFHLSDTLLCEIIDNGIGRKKSMEIKQRQNNKHDSFSTDTIKRRFDILSDLYKGDFGFSYTDLFENGLSSGTKVSLTLPIKHSY